MNPKLLSVFLSIGSLSLLAMVLMQSRPLVAEFILGIIIIICLTGVFSIKK